MSELIKLVNIPVFKTFLVDLNLLRLIKLIKLNNINLPLCEDLNCGRVS